MNFPENIKYSPEHTWLLSGMNESTIGITEFAQSELGEIVFVDLPDIGSVFKTNEVFGSIEALKTVSDLFMPVGGEVIAVNNDLKDNPTLVNDDPFEKGWLIKIKAIDHAEPEQLLNAETYKYTIGM